MEGARPLNIRKFIPEKVGTAKNPVQGFTFAINRMGFVVEDIGAIFADMHNQRLAYWKDQNDAENLQRDKDTENKLEADTEKAVESESKKSGVAANATKWLNKLLQPFKWIAMKVGTWFLLDLLSNPKFKGILDFSLPIIGKWLGSVYKILNTGVNWIMEAFGEKSLIMGALKIIGGLGAFFVATRVLQPWKLIGDYQSLVKFYKNTVGKTSWGKKLKRAQNIKKLRNERMKRVKRFGNMRNRIRARRTRMLRLKRLTRVKAGRFMQGKATGFLSKGMPFLAGATATITRLQSGDSAQKAIGGGVGAAIGGAALTALLTPILGPFGPIVGNLLGGFIGDKLGAFVGDAITPIIKPIKKFIGEIMMPLWKAYLTPLIDSVRDMIDALVPALKTVWNMLKPVAEAAVKKVNEFLNSPALKATFEKLMYLINLGQNVVGGTVNYFQRTFGSEESKASAQLVNENDDVKRLRKQVADLKKKKDKDGGSKRSIWTGVDGVIKTSNGAPGMNIMNGHRHPFGSTIDEKIDHWTNVLIPYAEQKAKDAEALVNSLEDGGGPLEKNVTVSNAKIFPLPMGRWAAQPGQRYGAPRSYGAHTGIDLTEKPPFGADPAIDVVALTGGQVLKEKYDNTLNYMAGLMIRSADGFDHRYLHMLPSVAVGDQIKAGQKIGSLVDMSKIGRDINDTHLHFDVYKMGTNEHLDPTKIYPGLFGTPNKPIETLPPDKLNNTSAEMKNRSEALAGEELSSGVQTIVVMQPLVKSKKEVQVIREGTQVLSKSSSVGLV